MGQRIVVLGGGYAGLVTANRLARRLSGVEITLVNERAVFAERVRLHQLATGQAVGEHPLAERLRPGVRLVVGRVRAIDADTRTITVGETDELVYDTLVYALGSRSVSPGEHAVPVSALDEAYEVRERVTELARERGTVAVVGGGLTGIETAAELAERHPGLRVRLVTAGELGERLSRRGAAHLRRVFDRLGVEVVDAAQVDEVTEHGVELAGGGRLDAGLTVWSAGFAVPELAAKAGFAVDPDGRLEVEETMRSTSHPEVYAVGDSALAHRANGLPLRMACATGLPMAYAAADAIAARLTDRQPRPLRFRFVNQCVSLGRNDGLVQYVDADDRPREMVLTGRTAARYKEAIVRIALWVTAHSGPYRPNRRRAA